MTRTSIKAAIGVDFDPIKKTFWACTVTGAYDDRNPHSPVKTTEHTVSGAVEHEEQIFPWLVFQAIEKAKHNFRCDEIDIRYVGPVHKQYKILASGMTANVTRHASADKFPPHMRYLHAKAEATAKKRATLHI